MTLHKLLIEYNLSDQGALSDDAKSKSTYKSIINELKCIIK